MADYDFGQEPQPAYSNLANDEPEFLDLEWFREQPSYPSTYVAETSIEPFTPLSASSDSSFSQSPWPTPATVQSSIPKPSARYHIPTARRRKLRQALSATEKRDAKLAKNCEAARKCRNKKQMWEKELEQQARTLQTDNMQLLLMVERLKQERLYCKEQIVRHGSDSGECRQRMVAELKFSVMEKLWDGSDSEGKMFGIGDSSSDMGMFEEFVDVEE